MHAVSSDIAAEFAHRVAHLERKVGFLEEAVTTPFMDDLGRDLGEMLTVLEGVGATADLARSGAVASAVTDGIAGLGDHVFAAWSSQKLGESMFRPNAVDGFAALGRAEAVVEHARRIVPTLAIADDARAVDLTPILARAGREDTWATNDLQRAIGQIQQERIKARIGIA